jgi:glycosyltransferase involved in cell wall biosynthesis
MTVPAVPAGAGGTPLPTVSVVVPNFNGGATLGRTLDSLVGQNYPALEIIVCDGGSTDDSRALINGYADRIAWWCSEPDRGQSHAINKGFARATGEIVNWLCSDDVLLPEALTRIGRYFADHPDCDVLAGQARQVDPTGRLQPSLLRSRPGFTALPAANCIVQPSCFYRRRLLDRFPPLAEDLHYVMDFELWNYFHARGASFHFLDDVLAVYELSPQTKSGSGGSRIIAELERVYAEYSGDRWPLTWWHRRLRHPMEKWVYRHRSPLTMACVYWPWRVATSLALGPFYGFERAARMDWLTHAY